MTAQLTELPTGWCRASLGEITLGIDYGFTAAAEDSPVGPRLLRITDLQNGSVDWPKVPYCRCDRQEKYCLKKGDIVVARTGATTGKSFLLPALPEPTVFASYLIRLSTSQSFPAEYIDAFLHSDAYWRQITTISKGTAQPGANATVLGGVQIPLAPANEQRRIVAKLGVLLQRCGRAREALDAIPPLLERLRQSILAAAFRGALTADWRAKNPDEPASKLLERIRVERRRRWEQIELERMRAKGKPKDNRWKERYEEPATVVDDDLGPLPEGWCWTRLDNITLIKGGLALGKKRDPGSTLVSRPYLRVANVQRGFLDLREMKTVEVTVEEARDLALQPGDVLFNEGGDRDKLGRGWIWSGEIADCIHQNHVFRARPVSSQVLPGVISWYANTFGQTYFLDEGKQTTNLASISMTKLSGLPVPLVPAAEQIELERRVAALLERADRLAEVVQETASRASSIDEALLAEAFRGELVPQDPADEPASVLLERIKAQREQSTSESQRPSQRRKLGAAPARGRLID